MAAALAGFRSRGWFTPLLARGRHLQTDPCECHHVASICREAQPNRPYWTLSYELVFYVVVALVLSAKQLNRIDRLAVSWLMAMIVVRSFLAVTSQEQLIYTNWWFQIFVMPQFGHLFIAGMMIYRISTGRSEYATILALLQKSGLGPPLFEDPIRLDDGRTLRTLCDAGEYMAALPETVHDRPEGRAALEALLLSATGR